MRTHIHREGRRMLLITYVIVAAIDVVVFFYTVPWIFAIVLLFSLLVAIFITYFFRNPMRVIEVDDPNYLIAPADGRVVVIEPVMENEYFHEERLQVSIFMSPFNVHANWYPIEGKVLVSTHQKGRHKGAWLPKSSIENERSLVVLEHSNGMQIAVRQVAGAMARRIVTYAKPGMEVKRNQHLGFIKLGSRVDMYLPVNTEIEVEVGDPVHGNETILGRLPD
ncbi:MAG: phosphatidylserine decarboxylase family protein [Paludibacteraceae bacterium]|nr:phosphatidylserine decarboxylase family protein [Paludibacteraceae bacterium]